MRKYFNPVFNPHIPKIIKDATMTPIILPRIRGPPQIRKMKPIIKPSNPIIEPKATKNSIPSIIASK